jgi:hypothetical protein
VPSTQTALVGPCWPLLLLLAPVGRGVGTINKQTKTTNRLSPLPNAGARRGRLQRPQHQPAARVDVDLLLFQASVQFVHLWSCLRGPTTQSPRSSLPHVSATSPQKQTCRRETRRRNEAILLDMGNQH